MKFYKEERFKKTDIGEVPEDWEVVELKDIAKIIQGFAFKSKEFQKEGIPILRISNIKETGKIIFNKDETVYLSEKKLKNLKEDLILKPNDIVIALSGATTGKVGLYTLNYPALLNQRVAKIVANNKIDQLFIYYTLLSKSKELLNKANQMAQPNLSKRDLENLKIPLPPLDEQQKIAEILSKTDKAIQKVDESIEKFEKLKKGLMNILLNGKVRIKVEDGKYIFYKEERFKKSDIGRVPEDWEVVKLGRYIEYTKGKKPKVMDDICHKGYLPYLSTDYLRNGKAEKYAKITGNEVLVNEGDILLLWDGSNAGEFFLGKKGVLSSTMVKLNVVGNKYLILFLYYLLKSKENILKSQTKGTGIPHVDKNIFENLKIPLPPIEEQKAIAEILTKIDKVIQIKKQKKEKLQKTKKYLMNNLLTGKIRVKT